MKFRISQFVEQYETHEFEAKDEADALAKIKLLNAGEMGLEDIDAELVDTNPVDGGPFTLTE